MGLNTKSKAAKAYVSGNAATDIATQSIQTALSGSSYILSDVTRGNGVQTYNMKRNHYGSAVNFTDSNTLRLQNLIMSIKTMALLMHIGSRKPMTIGPPFTEETVTII
jgi:hypothetical protein